MKKPIGMEIKPIPEIFADNNLTNHNRERRKRKMEKPIGISNGDGTITLTDDGLEWICSFIKKGETITQEELIRRINKELKKGEGK